MAYVLSILLGISVLVSVFCVIYYFVMRNRLRDVIQYYMARTDTISHIGLWGKELPEPYRSECMKILGIQETSNQFINCSLGYPPVSGE